MLRCSLQRSWASGTVPDLGAGDRLPMVGSMGGVGPSKICNTPALTAVLAHLGETRIAHGNMPMLPCLVPMADLANPSALFPLSPDSQSLHISAPGTDLWSVAMARTRNSDVRLGPVNLALHHCRPLLGSACQAGLQWPKWRKKDQETSHEDPLASRTQSLCG